MPNRPHTNLRLLGLSLGLCLALLVAPAGAPVKALALDETADMTADAPADETLPATTEPSDAEADAEPDTPAEATAPEEAPTAAAEEPAPADAPAASEVAAEPTPCADERTSDPLLAEPAPDEAQPVLTPMEDTTPQEELPADEPDQASDDIPDLPADAVDPAGLDQSHTYLIETGVADNLVLAAKSASAGASVSPATYAKNDACQLWRFVADAQSGWYRILLAASKGALGLAADATGSLRLAAFPTEGTDAALLWAFANAESGGYRLLNALLAAEGLTAQASGAGKAEMAATSADEPAQRFHLIDTTPTVAGGETDKEGCYNLALKATGTVAEVKGASTTKGANVQLYASNGKKHQKFYLEYDGKGYYTAWIVGTRQVLDVRGGSILPGTNVIQWTSSGKDNQKWALRANDDGTYRLVNKATGLVLGREDGSNNLVGRRDDGSAALAFDLKEAKLLSAGIFLIMPRTDSTVALDVQRASTTDGASLLLYKRSGALNQRYQLVFAGAGDLWRIRTASSGGWITYSGGKVIQKGKSTTAASDANTWRATFKGGWYSLVNVASGKALDMRGGSTKSGTQVIAYKPNGRDSQHFTFIGASLVKEGTFYLRSAYGTQLDVKGGKATVGTNVQTYRASASTSQRFRLEKAGSGFRIVNAYTGLAIAPSDLYQNGSTKDTTNVCERLASGKAIQVWKPQIADGGYLSFVNAANDYALTTEGKASGANVTVAKKANSDGQRWRLRAAATANSVKTKTASTHVLMLGNSFTFYSDVPTLLSQQLKGADVICSSRGSAHLKEHTSTSDGLGKRTQAAIKEGGWDYVVIQAMTTEALDDWDTYLTNLTKLVKLIRQAGATPVIYGTWAFVGGNNGTNVRYQSDGKGALNTMDAELRAAFTKASTDAGVKAANGGKAVAVADTGKPFKAKGYDASLYCDGKHASATGAKLAAQTLATTIKSLAK